MLDLLDGREEGVLLVFVQLTADDQTHVLGTVVLGVEAADLVDGQLPDVGDVAAKIGGVGLRSGQSGNEDM